MNKITEDIISFAVSMNIILMTPTRVIQDDLIAIEPDHGGAVHLDDTSKIWMPDLYIYALKRIRPG